MRARQVLWTAVVAAGPWLPRAAEAHTYGAAGAGFLHGLGHPLGGLDHLLAMVAVGLWAAQIGGRALWLVPAAFVAMMLVGGALGMAGIGLPMAEMVVVASVLVLGTLVASASRLPVAAGMAVTGLFALFHGHAHGVEMPEAASPALYGLGFVLTTVALHAIGVGLGLAGRRGVPAILLRLGGGAIAAVGILMLLGA